MALAESSMVHWKSGYLFFATASHDASLKLMPNPWFELTSSIKY
jgi:hypothetical protein